MKNNLKKNFILNSIGSTIYAFTSLFFLIIVTRINDINEAGIFTFAFSNACLLQVIGTYSGRSFQVTETNKKITDNDYVYNRTFASIIMIIIGILFGLIRGYDSFKLVVVVLLIVFKSLDAFTESLYGIIQKNDRLYNVGISLTIKGIIEVIVFLVVDLLTKNIILACTSIIVINLLVILLYDFRIVHKCNFKLKNINFNNVLTIYKIGFYTFVFTLLTQYLINAPKYSIDTYLSNDIQTIYGIIAMPATFVILISNFFVQPYLNDITNFVKKKEFKDLNKMIVKMVGILFGLFIILELCLYLLGPFAFNILYGIDTSPYLKEILIIFAGAFFYGVTIIVSNVLIALRKTLSQTIIFAISSIAAFVLCDQLVLKTGIAGAALSYFLSMFLLFVLYIIIYTYVIRKEMTKNG